MTTPSPDTVHRLALIRLLLDRAEEASRQAAPFSADSINRLHDVAEMWLLLGAEVLHADIKPKMPFINYWDVLSKKLDFPLTYKAQMQRVNEARVNLKHHGNEPSQQAIEHARTAVRGLLEDETPRLFGIGLRDVSLADFVACEEARALVKAADEKWKQQSVENRDIEGAPDVWAPLADLAEAFSALIGDYTGRKRTVTGRSVFDVVGAPPDLRSTRMRLRKNAGRGSAAKEVVDAFEHYAAEVADSLSALQELTLATGLGVDLRRYGRFRLLTPRVSRASGGGRRFVVRESDPAPTDEDFEFCRDFVISTALHLAEFDFDRDLRDARLSRSNAVRVVRE